MEFPRDKESAVSFLLNREKQDVKKKRVWSSPFLETRDDNALRKSVDEDLRYPKRFAKNHGMSPKSFMELFALLHSSLRFKNTNMRQCISARERLIVTLRYLKCGYSLMQLHYMYKIGTSTLAGIIKDVCNKILTIIQPIVMPVPDADKHLENADLFWERTNFPNCVGAFVGKCLRVSKAYKPPHFENSYKKFVPIILLAACDANYSFIQADVVDFENQVVFNGSTIPQMFDSLPPPRPLPGTSTDPMPFLLAGDSAFSLKKKLMRPYATRNLEEKKLVFNYRLARANLMAEATLGILSNKWAILQKNINLDYSFAKLVIKACIVLHNFVRERDGYEFEHTLTQVGLQEFDENGGSRGCSESINIRADLADYFVGVGSVPWQLSRISNERV